MYSFSSRSKTSTFSATCQCRQRSTGEGARTVNHVQKHRGGQEGLRGEVYGQDRLSRWRSSSAQGIRWELLRRRCGIVYPSVTCGAHQHLGTWEEFGGQWRYQWPAGDDPELPPALLGASGLVASAATSD